MLPTGLSILDFYKTSSKLIGLDNWSTMETLDKITSCGENLNFLSNCQKNIFHVVLIGSNNSDKLGN